MGGFVSTVLDPANVFGTRDGGIDIAGALDPGGAIFEAATGSDILRQIADPIGALDYLKIPEVPGIPGSQTYNAADRIGNTIREGIFAARCYGRCKIGGNKLRFNDPDADDLRIIVAHCAGSVEGVVETQINDVEWSELSGTHTKTEYTGTRIQTPDSRFTDDPSAYRSMAYTGFTFEKDDKQVGSDPNITVVMDGLLCAPLAGGADAFTRNNSVIMYDWYLSVEGYQASELDLNAFKSLEALCDEVPTDGTLPRYRFDFNIDSNMSINDAKKIIWSSFNGRVIMSQGKLKPVWDSAQEADGAGGLQAKSISYAFDLDNIVKDSFTWQKLERPNLVRIYFKDSEKDYKTSTVEIKDEFDIQENGEILYEENAWYITNAEIARRRAKFKYNKKRYPDYGCKFTALSGASKLEVYDLVTVTHILPGWTNKSFIVTSRGEDNLGRMEFTLEAYFSGAYDDSEVADQGNFASNLPNPFVPDPVTNVGLEERGFVAGDGSYVPYVILTFTKPDNVFWFRGQVFTSTDGGVNYTFYGNASDGDGYRLTAAKADYEAGDTLCVKVLSENDNGTVQKLSEVTEVTEFIDGKNAPPSDVTNFTVTQIGDIVVFEADRPSQALDADFSYFDVRQGSSWETAGPVVTYETDKKTIAAFTEGAKTYWIKAFDTSGNESVNAASFSIILTKSSAQNVFFEEELIYRIEQGTASNIKRNYVFDGTAGGFFIAGTQRMDDSPTRRFNDNSTDKMWKPAYTSGYLETEKVDAGEIVNGAIFLDLETIADTGTGLTVEYKTSQDDITYTSYATFVNGTTAIFRYIIFKITLTADTTTYPQNNIKVTSMFVTFDLPTIINESVTSETIAAGGTTITFSTPYTTAESIQISITPISSTALLATHETATKTNFKAHLFDTAGNDVGGTCSWRSEGF